MDAAETARYRDGDTVYLTDDTGAAIEVGTVIRQNLMINGRRTYTVECGRDRIVCFADELRLADAEVE